MLGVAPHHSPNQRSAADPLAGFWSALQLHAASEPRRPALVSVAPDGAVTGELDHANVILAITSLASTLIDAGARSRVVMVESSNSLRFALWMLAGLAAGARVFPVHASLPYPECASLAARSLADFYIGSPSRTPPHVRTLDAALADHAIHAPQSRPILHSGDFGQLILLSSGTTSRSKLAVRCVTALAADGTQTTLAAGLSQSDRVLVAMPLCHSYGVDMMMACLHSGAALYIMERFEPDGVARQLSSGVTVFPGVPFMFEALARLHPPRPLTARLAFSAGATLPRRVWQAMHHAWGLRIGQLYGATELGAVMFNHPDHPAFDPHTVGLPMPGVSVRVLHPDDPQVALPSGRQGQVAISAPSMLRDYFPNDPPPLEDGHFLTGDLGMLDDSGRLTITGRLKFLIDVGGFKVNPLDVEDVLSSHPGVRECAILPLPLSDTVTKLRAIVVPTDPETPPSAEELRAFLRARVAAYKVPRNIEYADSLPRSPTGKLMRRHLLEPR